MKWPHWVVYVGGVLSGMMLLELGQACWRGKIPEGLGDLLSGLAAVLGVVLVWAGFAQWETQRRKTKRADAAAEALSMCFEFRVGVGHAAGTLRFLRDQSFASGVKSPAPGMLGTAHEQISSEALRQRWQAARNNAAIYLPRTACAALDAFHDPIVNFGGMLALARAMSEQFGTVPVKAVTDHLPWSSSKEEEEKFFSTLLEKVTEELSDIARLE